MDQTIDFLLRLLEVLQAPIAGLLTVYLMAAIKKVSKTIAGANPTIQILLVPLISFLITEAGAAINLALPTDLTVWDPSTANAAISSGIAYGIHAGRKWRTGAVAILLLLLPSVASAQELPSLVIEGITYDSVTGIATNCPLREIGGRLRVEGYRGQTIRCQAWAVNADGAYTPGDIHAVDYDSTFLSIDVDNSLDPEGYHQPATLAIHLLRPGNWSFRLTDDPVVSPSLQPFRESHGW